MANRVPPSGARGRLCLRPMTGLYAFKPWYGRQLQPIVSWLGRRGVSPDAVSVAGIGLAAGAGATLAFASPGPLTAIVVGVLLAGRLACANMDGTLARRRAPRPFGGLVNELGDRAADLVALAGFSTHLGWPTAAVLLAATLPSWVALAVAASGGARSNVGPVGKTERCALMVVAALSGLFAAVAIVISLGSAITAVVRLRRGAQSLHVEAQL